MRITLAYSVDADDAFMFHGLATGAVDTREFTFLHQRGDTAWLNALAAAEGADVVAVSAGAYPSVADKYLLLPHGASVGRGFGPVLVSRRPMRLAELSGRRVAVPGLRIKTAIARTTPASSSTTGPFPSLSTTSGW